MLNQLFNLEGKVALVTGGAGHLGTAISEALAEAGAITYIGSKNYTKCSKLAESITAKFGIKSHGIELDVSREISVSHCVESIVKEEGHIDILINNAYYGKQGRIENMSEEDWYAGIDGSINGVFRCCKYVLPFMKLQNSGVIINIASMYGVVSPDPAIYGDSGFNNPPNYGTGKAGIIQLTKYIACHYGNEGIRANSISPGPFPNPKVQLDKDFIQALEKKNPIGRIGHPNDLKGVVVFLSSDSSGYITGQNINVDGGWTAW